ncbi:MAG: hypothetical protein A3K10_07120 [Bacteroidetes bacterium RIFCSPLOWO2_12_FULL_31_6]|nr:MAG: hypothetical protein A3K10_07120 [Bacteroidetes bacterium RIFCSPLOWO2_12_FULL_31_6]
MSTKNQNSIFIIEDNKVLSLALKADIEASFKKKPLHIQTFETGEACMKNFIKENPPIVILDYHLNSVNPKAANGIKVLDWIKKEHPGTHVIMLTSDDHLDVAVKSFQHGATDYVVKTETQFKKIYYSLSNIFKMMEAKKDAKKYKMITTGVFMYFVMMVIALIVGQRFYPGLFR